MKQFTLTTIPVLCAAIAPLCADTMGSNDMGDKAPKQQRMAADEEITPQGDPTVMRCADPFITADFIWWRAQEDNLDYAFNGTVDPTSPSNADHGKIHHPHFQYEPGFKVGAGLKFKHDGWDLFAQYTWFNVEESESKNSVRTDADGDSNVQTNIAIPELQGFSTYYVEEAKAKWSLNFNVLDLELGRNFWVSKNLTLRPFIGMKFDWMTQDFDVTYDDLSDADGALIEGDDYKLDFDQKQWAVGLRAGLNSAYYMWTEWCIFGELAASGMLNDFDSSRKDKFSSVESDLNYVQNHVARDSHSVSAVLEWSLGLRYEHMFHNDDFLFSLQAGWEQQIWFNQNQFVFFQNSGPADLSLQGLTIKAAMYF
jgi:hypothetical protein